MYKYELYPLCYAVYKSAHSTSYGTLSNNEMGVTGLSPKRESAALRRAVLSQRRADKMPKNFFLKLNLGN